MTVIVDVRGARWNLGQALNPVAEPRNIFTGNQTICSSQSWTKSGSQALKVCAAEDILKLTSVVLRVEPQHSIVFGVPLASVEIEVPRCNIDP